LDQVYDARNLLGLLGDELVQRQQSGYEVEGTLADMIRAAVADGGTTPQEAAGR
jgi:hypothetical protein